MEIKKEITIESVLAAFDAMLAKSAAEFDRKIALSREEAKQAQERNERDSKEWWERNERNSKKAQERFERIEDLHAQYVKDMQKSREDFDRRQAVLDEKFKYLGEQVTGISNSNGLFAEEYFLNSFEIDHLNFFGEKFDKVIRGKGYIIEDEYDFVLINGTVAAIVEVKYKARKEDIQQALKKVNTFRINFPEYQKHKIYLGIAALAFRKELARECNKEGIAVIKQKGDKLIIYDKNIKVF